MKNIELVKTVLLLKNRDVNHNGLLIYRRPGNGFVRGVVINVIKDRYETAEAYAVTKYNEMIPLNDPMDVSVVENVTGINLMPVVNFNGFRYLDEYIGIPYDVVLGHVNNALGTAVTFRDFCVLPWNY